MMYPKGAGKSMKKGKKMAGGKSGANLYANSHGTGGYGFDMADAKRMGYGTTVFTNGGYS